MQYMLQGWRYMSSITEIDGRQRCPSIWKNVWDAANQAIYILCVCVHVCVACGWVGMTVEESEEKKYRGKWFNR